MAPLQMEMGEKEHLLLRGMILATVDAAEDMGILEAVRWPLGEDMTEQEAALALRRLMLGFGMLEERCPCCGNRLRNCAC